MTIERRELDSAGLKAHFYSPKGGGKFPAVIAIHGGGWRLENLELYRYLLRRNHTMYGARFSIGPDGDIYLIGRLALEHLTVTELDRIIGELYELVETWFQPVVGIAFGRRGAPRPQTV